MDDGAYKIYLCQSCDKFLDKQETCPTCNKAGLYLGWMHDAE